MDYKYLTEDDMAALRAQAGREAETAHYRALLAAEAAKAEGGDVEAADAAVSFYAARLDAVAAAEVAVQEDGPTGRVVEVVAVPAEASPDVAP
jgi:hypothetical protein